MGQQAPMPRLEEAFKLVAATTDEVISQRESVAELECRIDEGVYLLKGLMRVLRRAKAMVILMKPTVWPELDNYVHALESSVERASRYLSQLQDKWSHQANILLPHAEKLKRAAQRGLNEAASSEVLEVAASPKFVPPAPRVKKRVGRPATRRTASVARPPRNPARSGAISKRASRRRRSTLAAEPQTQETVQQAAAPDEVIVIDDDDDDDDGLGFLPPADPELNWSEAFAAAEAALLDNQPAQLQNTATAPSAVPRAEETVHQIDADGFLPPSKFNVDDPTSFILQVPIAELGASQAQDGAQLFNATEHELDALLNLTSPDANQAARAIAPADLVAPPVVHAAFDESVPQEGAENEEEVETDEANNLRETPSAVHGAPGEGLRQQEVRENKEAKETEEMRKLREMLEHSPEQMDIDALFDQTPVNVQKLESDLDGLNLDAARSDASMFNSPVGSEPETMRGNFQGDGAFDEELPVSPRIGDGKSPDRRWIPSSLFSDASDAAGLVPVAVTKACEYGRYRANPGSPSMFEVLRTPSPRVNQEIAELWDMDSFNAKDVPFVEDWDHPDAREKVEVTIVEIKEELVDRKSEEGARLVKNEVEPQIEGEYEEIYYAPRRNKHEPAPTEVAEIEEVYRVEEDVIEHEDGAAEKSDEDENLRNRELEIIPEAREMPRISKETSESVIDEQSEEQLLRKTKAKVRKPKTRTRTVKKRDKETKLERKAKRRTAKKQEDVEDVSRRPRTRAKKKSEEVGRDEQQKPKTKTNRAEKEDVENFVEQKLGTRRAKKEDVDELVEQKPKTRRVKKKSEDVDDTARPKRRGRRVKKKEEVEVVAEQKPRKRAAKKKVKDQGETDSAAPKPRTTAKKAETCAEIAPKASWKAQASVNRLYPKNQVRFKYEPKKSRHDKAYEIAASAPNVTHPARTPSSVNELYRTNSEVKFRYEPKPSRHDKAYERSTARRTASRGKPNARKKAAQETIERLFPKQAQEPGSEEPTASKPPRRSARLREQALGLECEVAERAPLAEVAAEARKRKAQRRNRE